MSAVLELAKELIARPSLTPDDAGCQQLIAARLVKLGFKIEHLRFGQVDNLWTRYGTEKPLLVFAGHTDVVPTGPKEQWHSDPFTPTVKDGLLYGRGAADMKGGLAAMVVAVEQLFATKPKLKGSIAFLITSDEEGPSVDGTVKVMELLKQRGEKIDWCVLGEPSCLEKFGDTIRHGRRGSLTGLLTVHGIQGHVAYPERADNPIHRILPALAELCVAKWDTRSNPHFPPTSFQISNFHSGTGAGNVIPGDAAIRFNFRYSTAVTARELQQRVEDTLRRHSIRYSVEWRPMGEPFLTEPGKLSNVVQEAVEKVTGLRPKLDTGGGTSDGRYIAPTGAEVIEFGPMNASIHKVNECVAVSELDRLDVIYRDIATKLLA
ncbi:MAG: succinyl-diaminopimelate desuccinylase [Gammaproteobacteria bacterium]|nr:succinyl-diaminopimelate desuccinylase [Gammaproteobacteria bacterium]MBU6510039.1 succinyl-diaminopimelate desuccinylase [Gammaproteobacteria bacterium]